MEFIHSSSVTLGPGQGLEEERDAIAEHTDTSTIYIHLLACF